jgi:CubicO group peptidase (beta-lactamase class C family)
MSKDIEINEPAFEDFNNYVECVLKDFKVPGMAVAIIKGDQIIHSKGYGTRNMQEELTVDSETVFAIGSASKAFTTMAMGILADRGDMDWDTQVREYMPTFKLHDPFASERMTPRDLVCHRSGLPRHDLMWYNSSLNRKDIFDRLRYLEPNKDFRTAWQYQNLMYLTAGYLVEKISGLTWEEFTQKEVFGRIGMERSNFSVEKSKEMDNYSLPYREEEDTVEEIPFRNIDTVGPAGSINSCLTDMANWVKLHLNGKVGSEEIISKAQLGEMHAPTMVIPSGFMGMEEYKELSQGIYGLGWFVQYYRGHKMVHHGGNIDGFSSLISFLPDENCGVVVLTNMNGTMSIMAITLSIYDRLLGLDSVDWKGRWLEQKRKMKEAQEKGKAKTETKKVKDTKPSHSLDAYVGDYQHPAYGIFRVEFTGEKLTALYNNLDMAVGHYHYDIFEAVPEELSEARLPLTFYTDMQGNISSLSVPFEPNVKDIVFKRVADESMKEKTFLEKFLGKYEIDGRVAEVILKGDDTLAVNVPGMPEAELEPYQGTEFVMKEMSIVRIEFALDERGEVSGFDLSQPGGVFTAKKIVS